MAGYLDSIESTDVASSSINIFLLGYVDFISGNSAASLGLDFNNQSQLLFRALSNFQDLNLWMMKKNLKDTVSIFLNIWIFVLVNLQWYLLMSLQEDASLPSSCLA